MEETDTAATELVYELLIRELVAREMARAISPDLEAVRWQSLMRGRLAEMELAEEVPTPEMVRFREAARSIMESLIDHATVHARQMTAGRGNVS